MRFPRILWILSAGIPVFARPASAIDFKIDVPPSGPSILMRAADTQSNSAAVFSNDELSEVLGKSQNVEHNHSETPRSVPKKIAEAPIIENTPPANSPNTAPKMIEDTPFGVPPSPFEAAPITLSGPRTSARNLEKVVEKGDANESFPNPACLKSNVSFWKKIYTETDTDDAVFHDKENLGRILGIVKIPRGERERLLAVRAYKDYFERRLEELSESLQKKDSWDSRLSDLAKLFPGNQLTRENILRTKANIRIQTGMKTRFEAGIQRSLLFLPTIQRVVTDSQLPLEIVYLPHVESSYHPQAKSKVGALGLWQIMPETMAQLSGRHTVSQRTDVHISTIAAAKLLRQNYGATKSWPLALTAYNHGLNGVLRAVRKTGSRDLCEIIDKYDSPTFRFASSNFYAQFLAARNAAKERYAELAKNMDKGKILKPVLAAGTKGRT
jgi:hypothetical protein